MITPATSTRAISESTAQLFPEAALMCVSVVVMVSAGRLFENFPLLTFLAVVVGAHFLAAVLRRLGVPMIVATVTLFVLGVLLLAWLYAPHTLAWSLPTPRTFESLADEMHRSFTTFRTMTAPAPAGTGFMIALAGTMWVLVVFADGATFSADAPAQAILPYAALFAFTSVLDRSHGYLLIASALATSVALFALGTRTLRQTRRSWAAGEQRRGLRSSRWVGILMVMFTVTTASGLVPIIPGTGGDGVVDLRRIGAGSGPRQVDSPLVSLQSLLTEQSDEVMFTVTSSAPHYWRQTALDDFNGAGWGSTANYSEIGDGQRLPRDATTSVPIRNERQTFEIDGLHDVWLPSAFQPTAVRSNTSLRFDKASSTLIVDDGASSPDDRYVVNSAIPQIRGDRLVAAGKSVRSPGAKYLALPGDFSPSVTRLARDLTVNADDDFTKALALQRFFREDDFVYDTAVDLRSSPDPLVAFLRGRRGFCQQFATAYAAMARSVGLASRVAVGFTYGDNDGTTWTVRGRNAHAWPEVYLRGAGWIAFEPTPGRGNPDATQYSGLEPAQAAPPVAAEAPTTSIATVPPASTGATPTTISVAPTTAALPSKQPASANATSSSQPFDIRWIIAGGLLVAFASALVARLWWVRRRRAARRASALTANRRVDVVWHDTRRDLRRIDIAPTPNETPDEFTERAAVAVGVSSLVELGPLETARRYSGVELEDALGEHAVVIADEVHEAVAERLGPAQKLRARLGL